MTTTAQRRQIAHLLVEQIGVGAMMDLERALRTLIIAKPAPKARCRQLRQPRGVFAPVPTHDVFVVGHAQNSIHWNNVGDMEREINRSMERFQR